MFGRWNNEGMAGRGRGRGMGRGGRPDRGAGPGPDRAGGPGFGFGPPGFDQMRDHLREQMFGRGRARRGNVRAAILSLLGAQPMNGYQIMQAIEQRSGGNWKPSSGSIYPTLQQLEDEDLVVAEEAKPGQSGSKTYKLSAKGKKHVDDNKADLDAEWDATARSAEADPRRDLMMTVRQVGAAAIQVATSGTPKQREEAKALLNEVRRNLYKILAETPDDEEG